VQKRARNANRPRSQQSEARSASPASERIARPRRILLAMDYYIYPVHQGVVDYARRAGWILDATAHQLGYLQVGWEADGILTYVGSEDKFGPSVRATGLPVVNMSPFGDQHHMPSVQLDNYKAGEVAAEHLLGRGFRDLTMIQHFPQSLTSDARCRGFKARVLEGGANFHSWICPHRKENGPVESQMARQIARQLLKFPKPLGVFTEGDLVAVEVIQVCQKLGLRVPEDVSVLGINNDPLLVDVGPIPVSSVDNNLHGLGLHAAELLDRILKGEKPPKHPILIPPRVVVQRRSTNTVAVDDEEVASTLAFIHAQFRQPIKVEDVVRKSNISRRRLQDLFIQHLGRGIAQEITHCRLELAKRLLFESAMKVSLIARQCGLGSGHRMSKVFARQMKVTPMEYRQRNTTNRSYED
jgi:LacI family transcriptional regulator